MVLHCRSGPPFPISSTYSTAARQGGILSVFMAVKHKSGTDSGRGSGDWPCCAKGCHGCRDITPWGEGFPIALQPLESEVVVEKMRMSGFFGTCLESWIRAITALKL